MGARCQSTDDPVHRSMAVGRGGRRGDPGTQAAAVLAGAPPSPLDPRAALGTGRPPPQPGLLEASSR